MRIINCYCITSSTLAVVVVAARTHELELWLQAIVCGLYAKKQQRIPIQHNDDDVDDDDDGRRNVCAKLYTQTRLLSLAEFASGMPGMPQNCFVIETLKTLCCALI